MRPLRHKASIGLRQPQSPHLQRLFTWAEAKGVTWSKVHYPVCFPPGHTGVQALHTIHPNEPIISIPKKLIISAQRLEKSELNTVFTAAPQLFKPTKNSYADDFRLMLFLLYETAKGEESDWYVYLRTLPSVPPQLYYWPADAMNQVQDASLVAQANGQSRLIKSQWRQISDVVLKYPSLFTPDMITLEKFQWAEGIVSSRAFGDGLPSHSLCPIAELVNHKNCATRYRYGQMPVTPTVHVNDDDDLPRSLFLPSYRHFVQLTRLLHPISPQQHQYLSITAHGMDHPSKSSTSSKIPRESDGDCMEIVSGSEEMYEKGAEVCLNYGAMSNRATLLRYGFCMEQDDLAYCIVTVDIKKYLTRNEYEKAKTAKMKTEWSFKVKKKGRNDALLTAFRTLLWRFDANSIESILSPGDISLDQSVQNAVFDLFRSTLTSFPTTISEDQSSLCLPSLPLYTRFAVYYRLQRKRILSHFLSDMPSSCSLVG